MFDKSPVLNELDLAAPVTAHLSPEIDPVATQDLQHLKQCISVLFAFYRRPLKDEEFIKYLQLWLERMVR
ncbi:ectopic P granules protein 5 homolog [Saccoglossus kowalevskii]